MRFNLYLNKKPSQQKQISLINYYLFNKIKKVNKVLK